VFLHLTSSRPQRSNDICTVDITHLSIDQLANDPPPGITTGCVDMKFIERALSNREIVVGVLDCLDPVNPVCIKRGYEFIADEIFRRANLNGQCSDCTQREHDLIISTVKFLQKKYPRELRLGLSYIG
ncbi:hypothetical protein Avbf_18696, partial [Armadillidium vulgare]